MELILKKFRQKYFFIIAMTILIALIFIISWNHNSKQNLALVYTKSVKEFLKVTDYRSALEILSVLGNEQFSRVSYICKSKVILTTKPIKLSQKNMQSTIKHAITGLDRCFLEYKYSLIPLTLFLLTLLVLMLTPSYFLFFYLEKIVKKNYLKDLKINEASYHEQLSKRVAHDIRSPLSALKMIGSMDPQTEASLKLMNASVDRISTIVDDLLRDNKKETKKKTVNDIIEEIYQEKKVEYKDEKINWNLDLKMAKNKYIQLPGSEFSRILSNLINNSIEARDKKDHTILVKAIGQEDDFVKISIYDNGKGMNRVLLNKVSEGNFGYSVGKKSLLSGGRGIGLSSAIKILKRYNSELMIKSVESEYTQIDILLKRDIH